MEKLLNLPKPGEIEAFDDYALLTERTWSGNHSELRAVLGVAGEAGEISEIYKKYFRGDFDLKELRRRLLKELGDVLYYIDRLAKENGFTLRQVADENIMKLFTRKNNSAIQGDGSDR